MSRFFDRKSMLAQMDPDLALSIVKADPQAYTFVTLALAKGYERALTRIAQLENSSSGGSRGREGRQ